MPLTRVVPQGLSYPYDIKRYLKGQSIKTIFDVGANVGQTRLFLSHHFPQTDIFAFEPIKHTCEDLKRNTKGLNKIKNFNYALGAEESQKVICLRENSELNTLINFDDRSSSLPEKLERVTITTVDSFCKSSQVSRIDILKMDVQGYELKVLEGAEYFIKNNLINFIYSEVGFESSNRECQYFSDLNKYLLSKNFRLSGFYELFRWGENKRYLGFCNALFVNCNL